MHIQTLHLRNFRNYEHLEMACQPGVMALVGSNGQGKTNLIEAVEVLATSKSPRARHDRELIRWREEFCCARVEVMAEARTERSVELTIAMDGRKRARLDGALVSSMSDWIGKLAVVSFFPTDLDIANGQASVRRRLLNIELSKVDPGYYQHYREYRHVCAQRNALLKDIRAQRAHPRQLADWDEPLARHAAYMIRSRLSLLSSLNPEAARIYHRLARGSEDLGLTYRCSFELMDQGDEASIAACMTAELGRSATQQIRAATTTIGPHRDDVEMTLSRRSLRQFGSRGQQRTAALSVKLALGRLMKDRLQEAPILLLDDALSELDADRRWELLSMVDEIGQTFITMTDAEAVKLRGDVIAKTHRVQGGRVLEIGG